MTIRTLGVLALALAVGGVAVALSPRRRALVAQKLAQSRRFVSQRAVDRDRRQQRDIDRWDDEGGATRAT